MKKIKKLLSLLLVTCFCFSTAMLTSGLTAQAGVSELSVVNSESLAGVNELPGSLWYLRDTSGTTVVNNEIVFAPTKNDSRFNLKRKINDLSACEVDLNFQLKANVLLSNIDGVTFAYGFGMNKVNSKLSDGAYLYFAKEGSTVGFGMKNDNDQVVPFTAIPSFDATNYVSIDLSVMSNGSATGSINGTTFTASDLPVEGYAGFGLIGAFSASNLVKMKDVSIDAYVNDTPENTDVFEDFDLNCFCINTFYAKSRPSGLANSKLTPANGKLVFNNTGSAAFETKVKYSNVDVSFDIVDVQRETSYNQDGSVNTVRSCAFGVGFGIDIASGTMRTKAPLIVEFVPQRGIKTNTQLVIRNGLTVLNSTILAENFDVFEKEDVFGVKISIKDSVVKVFMKNSVDNGYLLVAEQALDATPLGFFQIAAFGAFDANLQKGLKSEQMQVGSFSIDNLAIKNNDVGKILKVIDFMSNNACLAEDFIYSNVWDNGDLSLE